MFLREHCGKLPHPSLNPFINSGFHEALSISNSHLTSPTLETNDVGQRTTTGIHVTAMFGVEDAVTYRVFAIDGGTLLVIHVVRNIDPKRVLVDTELEIFLMEVEDIALKPKATEAK